MGNQRLHHLAQPPGSLGHQAAGDIPLTSVQGPYGVGGGSNDGPALGYAQFPSLESIIEKWPNHCADGLEVGYHFQRLPITLTLVSSHSLPP